MQEREINLGVMVAHSPAADSEALQRFAARMADDVGPALREATGMPWCFHHEEPTRLSEDDPRRPSDFLDEASLRMVSGPYDAVLVVTDVGLVSRKRRLVSGLASPLGRIVVISTRRLILSPRAEPIRPLDAEAVRWNAAALLIHLLGHLLGLRHTADPEAVMARFVFDESRRSLPRFTEPGEVLRRRAAHLPEREAVDQGPLQTLLFHLQSALRHPGEIARALWRNRSLLLPLSLPALATAAVAPTLVLIFSAETWDVGVHMTNRVAASFVLVGIAGAAVYLTVTQNLFFPRKEKRVDLEHLAVVNTTVFLTVLMGMVGLFAMVWLLMLGIEFLVFPPDLMREWPSLENPILHTVDQIRIAAFVSTIGVLTGALAGGLEDRVVIHHLALFLDEP